MASSPELGAGLFSFHRDFGKRRILQGSCAGVIISESIAAKGSLAPSSNDTSRLRGSPMLLAQILSLLSHCGGGSSPSEACIAGATQPQVLEAKWIRSTRSISPARLNESDLDIPPRENTRIWTPWSATFSAPKGVNRRLLATQVFVPMGARQLALESDRSKPLFVGDSLRIYINGFPAGSAQQMTDSVILLDPDWMNRGSSNDILLVVVPGKIGAKLEIPRVVSLPDTSLKGMKLRRLGEFGFGYTDSGSPARLLQLPRQLLLSAPRNGSAEIHPYEPVADLQIGEETPDFGRGHFIWSLNSDVYWYQGWHRHRRILGASPRSSISIRIYNNGVCGAESNARLHEVVPDPSVPGMHIQRSDTVEVRITMFPKDVETWKTSLEWRTPAQDPDHPDQYKWFPLE